MSIHQHATIEQTVYFWFGSNDTSGSGADGATPVFDVRLAGSAAAAVPVLSGAATLLTHANYPPGCHEIAIAATIANGFVGGATYAVFATLAVDGQNPTGFVGSFTLAPISAKNMGQFPVTRSVLVDDTGSDTDRGTALRAAYAVAQGMSPTSTDWVWVVIPPGRYNVTDHDADGTALLLDTNYIGLVALEPEDGGNRNTIDYDPEGGLGPSLLIYYRPPKTEVYNEESATTTIEQSANVIQLKGFAIAQLNDTNSTFDEYHAFHCTAGSTGNAGSNYEQMYFWIRTYQEPANPHYPVAFAGHVYGTWMNCKANSGAWRISSVAAVKATLLTTMGVANAEILYTASFAGALGNAITVTYIDPPGNNVPLSVAVTGAPAVNIEVTLETDGASAPVSTAIEITTKIIMTPAAIALVILVPQGTGAGVAVAKGLENLTGGADAFGEFSATMYDCEAGPFSFIGQGGDAVGCRLVRCRSIGDTDHFDPGGASFGFSSVSKTIDSDCYFEDCEAGEKSFGDFYGVVAGTYIRCRSGNQSFGYRGEFSGYAEDCIAGRESFGNGVDGVLSGTLIRCVSEGADLPWRVEGATIEDSFLSIDTNNQACITLLADDTTTITNSTILVVEGGTGIPIHAAVAQNVAAVGNRYNNRSVAINGLGSTVTNVAGVPEVDVTYWLGTAAEADVAGVPNMNVIQINGALTDGSPAIANRPILRLQQLDLHCDINAQGAFQAVNNSANGYGFNMYGGVAGCRQQGDLYGCAQYGGTADLFLGDSGTIENAAGNVIQIGAELAAPVIVNEWETQSQADPTGFHVNVLEIEGGDATDALQVGAQAAIVANKLDHLVAVADSDDPVDDSIIAKLVSTTADWSAFVSTTDSLQSLRDNLALQATALSIKAKTDNLPGAVAKNVALDDFMFLMVSARDHITPIESRTVTATISKDGGAFAAMTNSVSEVGNGWYKIDITQPEMNADVVALTFTSAGPGVTGADPVNIEILTDT